MPAFSSPVFSSPALRLKSNSASAASAVGAELIRFTFFSIQESTAHGQNDCFRPGSTREDPSGSQQAGASRARDSRSPREKRHPPEELRLADGDQGRRNRRTRNRTG